MATYYVRGQTGSDAAAGTSGATAKQRHSAVAALGVSASDIINHAETQEATASATFNANGLVFQQESGQAAGILHGSHAPAFSATGTRSYRADIGSGKSVAGVIDRWDAREDADGRHLAWMVPLASAAAVDASGTGANGYFYDGTQYLYVQLNDGTNPSTLTGDDRVAWVEGGGVGKLTVNGDNTVIRNLRIERSRAAGSGTEYQFHQQGSGCSILFCEGVEAAVHSQVFLNASDDLCEDCTFWGGGQAASGAESNTPTGAYNATGHVTGIVYRRVTVHCYSHLKPDGNPINSSATIDACKIHTDGLGGREVQDCYFEDFVSEHYGQPGQDIDVSNCAAAPVDEDDVDAYPVRALRGGPRFCRLVRIGYNAAFTHRVYDLTGTTSSGNTAGFWVNNGCTVICVGCVFITDSGQVPGRRFFYLETGARLHLINCTFIDRSVNATGPHQIIAVQSTDFFIRAHRCIFKNAYTAGTITRLMGGDSGASAANYDFEDNWYHGIDATRWSNDAARNTPAEWLSVVDATGTEDDPEFEDINTTDPDLVGELAASSPLLLPENKVVAAGWMTHGINGLPYDGTIGAWQYGTPSGGGAGRGRSSAARRLLMGV